MNKVDRAGTFRFSQVLETGVSLTKNQYPSFNVRLLISEYWDEQEGEWVDWSSAEVEISSYFSLFGVAKKSKKIEPTLNHQQVMKVFGWDGKSFQVLANDDYSKVRGQVRIVDNDPEFADRNPFQVAFIDVFDADPGSQLRKLNADELKDLDAKFAMALQTSGKAQKAATVPAKKRGRPATPKTTPRTDDQAVEENTELTAEEKKAKLKEKSDRLRNKSKNSPAPPNRIPPARDPNLPEGKCTKQEAWEIVVELKNDDCDDDQLNAAWNSSIDEVAGNGVSDKDIMPEQWFIIKDKTLDQVGKF